MPTPVTPRTDKKFAFYVFLFWISSAITCAVLYFASSAYGHYVVSRNTDNYETLFGEELRKAFLPTFVTMVLFFLYSVTPVAKKNKPVGNIDVKYARIVGVVILALFCAAQLFIYGWVCFTEHSELKVALRVVSAMNHHEVSAVFSAIISYIYLAPPYQENAR